MNVVQLGQHKDLKMEFQMKEIFLFTASGMVAVMGWALAESVKGFLQGVASDFRELTNSVKSLNVKMATVIEKIEMHEKRIDRLEFKLEG